MKDNIVVVYGSGASFGSGYKVRKAERESSGVHLILDTNPPIDQRFFESVDNNLLEKEYYALWLFMQKYFPSVIGLGMEEVWTAVDLNHKHIKLDTYDWIRE